MADTQPRPHPQEVYLATLRHPDWGEGRLVLYSDWHWYREGKGVPEHVLSLANFLAARYPCGPADGHPPGLLASQVGKAIPGSQVEVRPTPEGPADRVY